MNRKTKVLFAMARPRRGAAAWRAGQCRYSPARRWRRCSCSEIERCAGASEAIRSADWNAAAQNRFSPHTRVSSWRERAAEYLCCASGFAGPDQRESDRHGEIARCRARRRSGPRSRSELATGYPGEAQVGYTMGSLLPVVSGRVAASAVAWAFKPSSREGAMVSPFSSAATKWASAAA
jgi:hypothetical protein